MNDRLDETNLVVDRAHDGEIFSLFTDSGCVELRFRDEKGVRYKINLGSVSSILVNEWREQNVILDIEILEVSRLAPEEFARLLGIGQIKNRDERIELAMRLAIERRDRVFHVNPSRGAEIYVLFQEISASIIGE